MRALVLAVAVAGCAMSPTSLSAPRAAGGPNLAITSPPHNAWVVRDKPFPLSGIKQTHPEDPGQAIALQWADGPDGPWTLCTLVGSPTPGPVECAAWCYTVQGTEFELEAVVVHVANKWVRAAVYLDQGATGSPIDSSGPILWRLRSEGGDLGPR